MKKIVIIFMICGLCFSFCSCGQNGRNETKPTAAATESSETETITATIDNGVETSFIDDVGLNSTFNVSGKNIFINVPNYQEIKKKNTELFVLDGEQYVAITADKNSKAKNIQEAHEIVFEQFTENIQSHSYVNKLNITKEITETINGVEVYKYEGTLNCALDFINRDIFYEAYVIGCSFIMDNTLCTITGSVINQLQEETQIAEIKTMVEAMAASIRTEA